MQLPKNKLLEELVAQLVSRPDCLSCTYGPRFPGMEGSKPVNALGGKTREKFSAPSHWRLVSGKLDQVVMN